MGDLLLPYYFLELFALFVPPPSDPHWQEMPIHCQTDGIKWDFLSNRDGRFWPIAEVRNTSIYATLFPY